MTLAELELLRKVINTNNWELKLEDLNKANEILDRDIWFKTHNIITGELNDKGQENRNTEGRDTSGTISK